MVFSSVIFLFLFLPITLVLYAVVGPKFRNTFLLLASILFYAWGEKIFTLIMLASITVNYLVGMGIDHFRNRSLAKIFLVVGIVFNVLLLSVFKYTNFATDNLNLILEPVGLGTIEVAPVHLPIGISFFTFQAMSYIIDVWRRDAEVLKSPINIGLYISLFPQLIAGPIVRYHDIAQQIVRRHVRPRDFAEGVERFIIGMGKKVLIANQVAIIADKAFALPPHSLSPFYAWLGSICFVLQVYFDFSGYSDMAIGLGRMFGFRFLENFNYPYMSKSITEFWTRWHISLSTWFRDYLYIPLGGNRLGPVRTYLNLITVFFLCGLWHGAKWNYVIWGLSHGFFMVLERLGLNRVLKKQVFPLPHIYLMYIFTTTLTIFRADTVPLAMDYLAVMHGFGYETNLGTGALLHVDRDIQAAIIAGIIFSFPVLNPLKKLGNNLIGKSTEFVSTVIGESFNIVKTSVLAIIFYMSIIFLSSGTYNPFIYYRF
ncbi:MAG: MBOAT family O-acyltransferase [Desulfobacterales bacterium]|jgi:alginate O-acetyltransferase complex protein AlgI